MFLNTLYDVLSRTGRSGSGGQFCHHLDYLVFVCVICVWVYFLIGCILCGFVLCTVLCTVYIERGSGSGGQS